MYYKKHLTTLAAVFTFLAVFSMCFASEENEDPNRWAWSVKIGEERLGGGYPNFYLTNEDNKWKISLENKNRKNFSNIEVKIVQDDKDPVILTDMIGSQGFLLPLLSSDIGDLPSLSSYRETYEKLKGKSQLIWDFCYKKFGNIKFHFEATLPTEEALITGKAKYEIDNVHNLTHVYLPIRTDKCQSGPDKLIHTIKHDESIGKEETSLLDYYYDGLKTFYENKVDIHYDSLPSSQIGKWDDTKFHESPPNIKYSVTKEGHNLTRKGEIIVECLEKTPLPTGSYKRQDSVKCQNSNVFLASDGTLYLVDKILEKWSRINYNTTFQVNSYFKSPHSLNIGPNTIKVVRSTSENQTGSLYEFVNRSTEDKSFKDLWQGVPEGENKNSLYMVTPFDKEFLWRPLFVQDGSKTQNSSVTPSQFLNDLKYFTRFQGLCFSVRQKQDATQEIALELVSALKDQRDLRSLSFIDAKELKENGINFAISVLEKGNYPHLCHLGLENNNLEPIGLDRILSLSFLNSLTALSLANNPILFTVGDFKNIERFKSLHTLDLSGTGLYHDKAKILFKTLANNMLELENLNISRNKITKLVISTPSSDSWKEMILSLLNLKKLKFLDLSQNDIGSVNEAKSLFETLSKTNITLKILFQGTEAKL